MRKYINRLWILMLVILLLGTFAVPDYVSASNITVELESKTVVVGSEFTVDVYVKDYPLVPEDYAFGLGAYDITVAFDPAELTIDSVDGGDAPFNAPVVDLTVPGSAQIVAFPGTGARDGDIKICTLNFTCLSESVSTLALTVSGLSDTEGTEMANTPVNGTVTQVIFPTITVDNNSGLRGQSIQVAGRSFKIKETNIVISWDGAPVYEAITADDTGSWTQGFTVPLGTGAGSHTIDAYGPETLAESIVDIPFEVLTSSIVTNITSGVSGDGVIVDGINFAVNETGISVLWDDVAVSENNTADELGRFTGSFNVPPSSLTPHNIDAYGIYTAPEEVTDIPFTIVVSVNIEDKVVGIGSKSVAGVWITDYPDVPAITPYGLGSYTIRVNFDPDSLVITDITRGDTPFDAPIFGIYQGYVDITQFSTTPTVSGNLKLCDLNFIGDKAGDSTLVLTVVSLFDSYGNSIGYRSENGTITQFSLDVEVATHQVKDTDGVVVVSAEVISVKEHGTQEIILEALIGNYTMGIEFNPSQVEIAGVRGGSAPFDTIDTADTAIDNVAGTASVSDTAGEFGIVAPVVMTKIAPILKGSVLSSSTLTIAFVEIRGLDGTKLTPLGQPMVLNFHRGDIDGNGSINIRDAMFGAQYVVGIRPVKDILLLNMASIKQDVGGVKADITDCMFLAQYIVGIRDNNMALVP